MKKYSEMSASELKTEYDIVKQRYEELCKKNLKLDKEDIDSFLVEIDLMSNHMKKVYVDEREIKPLYKEEDSQNYNNNNEDINDKVLLTKSDEIRMELEKKKQLIEQSKRAARENLLKEENDYNSEKLNTHESYILLLILFSVKKFCKS